MKKDEAYSETSDKRKVKVWRKWFKLFANNLDNRRHGHSRFMWHLATYLFFRVESGVAQNFNPTKGMVTCLYKQSSKTQWKAKVFFSKILNMSPSQIQEANNKGNAWLFKRVVSVAQYRPGSGNEKSTKLKIYSKYTEVKNDLDIICF